MDFRDLLPAIPLPWRSIAKALLDRLDSIERRLSALEQRQATTSSSP